VPVTLTALVCRTDPIPLVSLQSYKYNYNLQIFICLSYKTLKILYQYYTVNVKTPVLCLVQLLYIDNSVTSRIVLTFEAL